MVRKVQCNTGNYTLHSLECAPRAPMPPTLHSLELHHLRPLVKALKPRAQPPGHTSHQRRPQHKHTAQQGGACAVFRQKEAGSLPCMGADVLRQQGQLCTSHGEVLIKDKWVGGGGESHGAVSSPMHMKWRYVGGLSRPCGPYWRCSAMQCSVVAQPCIQA